MRGVACSLCGPALRTMLNALRMNDPDRLGDWFGRFITTYRASGEVMPVAIKWTLRTARIEYTMDRALLRGTAIVISSGPAFRRMNLPTQLRKIADSY